MGRDLGISLTKPVALSQDQALSNLRAQVTPQDRATIKQSSEEFESLFLNIVLKSMRDSVQKSGLIDGGNAEDIYRSMLDDEYSKMMAAQRHTGLADHIEEFLLNAQASTRPAGDKAAGLRAYQNSAGPAPVANAARAGIAGPAKKGDNE